MSLERRLRLFLLNLKELLPRILGGRMQSGTREKKHLSMAESEIKAAELGGIL